ncbi:MAG: transcriptional regulator, partial [Thaumarchaeota archaeon]|nr:transcriptional regulator [Nitrososphaerota archaeon]
AKRGGKPAGKEPKAKRGEKRGGKPAGKEPKAKRGARGGRQDAKRPGRRRRSRKAEVDEADITDEETLGEGITDEEIANFQVGKANMEQLINRVCEMLSGGPSGGTLQGDVWRRLKLTLSDGFRLALKLEWLGLITREKVLEDGRWTYRLILKRTPISTRSIVNAPCLTCPVEQKCTPDGEVSPHTCDLIRDWVLAEAGRARRRS